MTSIKAPAPRICLDKRDFVYRANSDWAEGWGVENTKRYCYVVPVETPFGYVVDCWPVDKDLNVAPGIECPVPIKSDNIEQLSEEEADRIVPDEWLLPDSMNFR